MKSLNSQMLHFEEIQNTTIRAVDKLVRVLELSLIAQAILL